MLSQTLGMFYLFPVFCFFSGFDLSNFLFTFHSPSSLTGKKSNELIQGGLSSLKSAANTMAKKFDEIKEKISTSANSTPIKMIQNEKQAAGDSADNAEGESTDGSEGGDRQCKNSGELGSAKGSCSNLKEYDEPLPDTMFTMPDEDLQGMLSFIDKMLQTVCR